MVADAVENDESEWSAMRRIAELLGVGSGRVGRDGAQVGASGADRCRRASRGQHRGGRGDQSAEAGERRARRPSSGRTSHLSRSRPTSRGAIASWSARFGCLRLTGAPPLPGRGRAAQGEASSREPGRRPTLVVLAASHGTEDPHPLAARVVDQPWDLGPRGRQAAGQRRGAVKPQQAGHLGLAPADPLGDLCLRHPSRSRVPDCTHQRFLGHDARRHHSPERPPQAC